jgi:flagellin-like protein
MTHATLVSKGTHRHTRKAISPIIATIILIVITVAIGGLLYAYVSGMFGSMSTSQDVNIQNTLTIPPGASYGSWTVSVKDTGTVAITNMTAVLYSSSGSPIAVIYAGSHPMLSVSSSVPSGTFTSSTVSPGQTVSGSVLNIPSSSVIAGSSYNYQLVVQFANGVQKTYTGAVTAESY